MIFLFFFNVSPIHKPRRLLGKVNETVSNILFTQLSTFNPLEHFKHHFKHAHAKKTLNFGSCRTRISNIVRPEEINLKSQEKFSIIENFKQKTIAAVCEIACDYMHVRYKIRRCIQSHSLFALSKWMAHRLGLSREIVCTQFGLRLFHLSAPSYISLCFIWILPRVCIHFQLDDLLQ